MTHQERLKFLAETWNDESTNPGPPEFAVRFLPELISLQRAFQQFEIMAPGDREKAAIALEEKVREFEDLVVRGRRDQNAARQSSDERLSEGV